MPLFLFLCFDDKLGCQCPERVQVNKTYFDPHKNENSGARTQCLTNWGADQASLLFSCNGNHNISQQSLHKPLMIQWHAVEEWLNHKHGKIAHEASCRQIVKSYKHGKIIHEAIRNHLTVSLIHFRIFHSSDWYLSVFASFKHHLFFQCRLLFTIIHIANG